MTLGGSNHDTVKAESLLDTATEMPEGAEKFRETMSGLLDGKQKEEAVVERAFAGQEDMFDLIAAKLYTIASMLVGEGEESIQLVEAAVRDSEVCNCESALEASNNSKRVLAREALERISARDAEALAAPECLVHAETCIGDDDLDAAIESGKELERILAGPDRDHVREWLAGLPVAMRTIYVMRAVAGISAPETAALLVAYGGPKAAGWTATDVREIFRQGLCSLASQLLHEKSRE